MPFSQPFFSRCQIAHVLFAVVTFLVALPCTTSVAIAQDLQSQWQKIGPGGGGATFIPTFSYHSDSAFLLKCDMTGSYLTKNGGKSYHQINLPNGAASFAYAPTDSNTIYIGSTTLARSSDGGKSWEKIFPAKEDILNESYLGDHANYYIETKGQSDYETGTTIQSIRVDPVFPSHLYFGMGSALFFSSDKGKAWKKIPTGSPVEYLYTNTDGLQNELLVFTADAVFTFNKSSHVLQKSTYPEAMRPAFSFTAGRTSSTGSEIIYALHHDAKKEIRGEFGHTEIWKSEDRGRTWKRDTAPMLTNLQVGVTPSFSMIACAEFDAAHVYLVTNRYEEKIEGKTALWYGTLKTSNGGNSWDWVWKGGGGTGRYGIKDGLDATNLTDAWVQKAFGGEYIRLMDVGVSPHNGNVAVVTDWYRSMKTIDGGKSWSEIYSERVSDETYRSRGLDVTTSYGVHFDPFDSNHLAISYTDIGYHHSFDGGKSWARSVAGVPTEWVNTCYWIEFDPAIKGKMWSAWSGLHDFPRGKMTRDPQWRKRARGGICVSYDGGKNWQPITNGMGTDSPATCLVLDPTSAAGQRTLYACVYSKGVFKSTDDGKTWQLKNKGIGENTCAFELTRCQNGTLFLTVSPTPAHKEGKRGRDVYSGAVYRSTDGAETWTRLHVSDNMLFPNGIACDPQNPDRIYLAGWADIHLSDLVGGDVARATGGNERLKIPGGISLSEDGGDTWRTIFDEKDYVYDVTPDPARPGRLYANTFTGSAWRSDDAGKTWNRIKGYDFHWGQRITVDIHHPEKIYINTFGSSVWHGEPKIEPPKAKNPNGRNDAWGFVGLGGGGAMFSPTVSPHNPNRAFVSCDMTGSFATYDGGSFWRMFNLKGPIDYYVFDPIDSNTVYANSIALFKSVDRGHTWSLFYPQPTQVDRIISKGDHASELVINKDSTLRRVLALAIDPSDSRILYASISVDERSALYRSEDGGIHWQKLRELPDQTKNIFIHPYSDETDRTLVICGKNWIAKREKGIWKANKTPEGITEITQFSAGFDRQTRRHVLYAIAGQSYFHPADAPSGIFYSHDGGERWENRQEGLANLGIKGAPIPEWRCIATSESNPAIVYVSYANLKVHADTTCLGVARSDDYGKTWRLVWKDKLTTKGNTPAANWGSDWINERFSPTWGENPFSIGVSPTHPEICYTTDFGRTAKTTDGGTTWQQVYSKRKEGAGWTSRGLEVTTSYAVVFNPFDSNQVFIANTDIGLMESREGGESWLSATANNGIPRSWINSTYWLEFDPEIKGKVWAVMSGTHDLPRPKMWRRTSPTNYRGGLVVSEDAGKSWRPVSGPIGEGAMTHVLIDRASPPHSRTLYVCVFGKGVYKSKDGGKTWQQKNSGIIEKEPFAWRIVQRDEELFLIVSRREEDGSIGADGDGAVYRSNDGAETWRKIALPDQTNGPTSLAVDPANKQRLILSAWGRKTPGKFSPDIGGGIFVSDNDGKSWKQVMHEDQHIHDITYDPRNRTFYACGFNGSAYRSKDDANSWERIKGYNFKWGKRVDPDPRDPEKIFIVTFGGGVWYGPAGGDPSALEDIVEKPPF
jgi:photosystem II stability/assembly factor-like uncharacterized protein